MVERDKQKPAGHDPAVNAEMTAETERLGDELAEVREQLAATSEVLAVIARSASDLEGVLETVVESRGSSAPPTPGRYSWWTGTSTGWPTAPG